MTETTLRRELGLRDLTLFAIACIVGARWIPAAAHAGPGSVTLWLLAAIFFVVPLAASVAALSVKYPGAGGLYLWTRGDFGPWHGFLCFWMYWMGIASWFPTAALFYMKAGFSMLGGSYARLSENRIYLLAVALGAIWIALTSNLVGLKGRQVGHRIWAAPLPGSSARCWSRSQPSSGRGAAQRPPSIFFPNGIGVRSVFGPPSPTDFPGI